MESVCRLACTVNPKCPNGQERSIGVEYSDSRETDVKKPKAIRKKTSLRNYSRKFEGSEKMYQSKEENLCFFAKEFVLKVTIVK